MPSIVNMNSPVAYWGNTGLIIFGGRNPVEHAINIVPNVNLKEGTLMGEVTATPGTYRPYAGSTVGTPAAQTPTLATATTGGFLAGNQTVYVVYTWVNGAGETVKSTEASIAIPAGTSTNTVTATAPIAVPPGAIGMNVYIGTVSGTNYLVGTTPTNAFVVTSLASGTVAPPGSSTAIASTDGSQVAKCVLRYPVSTDAYGNIMVGNSYGTSTGIPVVGVQQSTAGLNFNLPEPCVDALFGGFECWAADLPNLDSAAISAGFGRIENGALGGAGAVFRLP